MAAVAKPGRSPAPLPPEPCGETMWSMGRRPGAGGCRRRLRSKPPRSAGCRLPRPEGVGERLAQLCETLPARLLIRAVGVGGDDVDLGTPKLGAGASVASIAGSRARRTGKP